MHKEYMLSCFNLNKMEDEEDFFESIDEMKSYIEQGGENIIVEGTDHLDEISIDQPQYSIYFLFGSLTLKLLNDSEKQNVCS